MAEGDSLTNLQRVALRGEVAYAVSTAAHNTEIKYRVYSILKEVEEEYKPFLIDAFKEAVNFDEKIIDRIYLETLYNEVPIWLWVEKAIADIKESINLTEITSMSKTSISKVAEREKIIESAFINFGRKALMISAEASEQLFDSILEDSDLIFLHTSCFYLKSSCEEIRDCGTVQDKIPEELMECHFDIRDVLNLRIETEVLNTFLDDEKTIVKPIPKKAVKKTEKILITPDMSEKEISDLINKKIFSVFSNIKEEGSFKYVVNKIFNSTQISTTIRVCDTREEAEQFIEKIKKEYPELQNTCEFFISKERKDGQ